MDWVNGQSADVPADFPMIQYQEVRGHHGC